MSNYEQDLVNNLESQFKENVYVNTLESNAKQNGKTLKPNERESYSRLEFPAKVKVLLAARVGFICSYPNCNQVTIGPKGNNEITVLGEAAHIYGAIKSKSKSRTPRPAPEGYTEEKIKSLENGIWLCRHHHKLIDAIWSPEGEHSPEELKGWKKEAEARQSKAIKEKEPVTIENIFKQIPDSLCDDRIQVKDFKKREWALIVYLYQRNRNGGCEKNISDYAGWISDKGIKPNTVGLEMDDYYFHPRWHFKDYEWIANKLANVISIDDEENILKMEFFDEIIDQLWQIDPDFDQKMIENMKSRL